MRTIRVKEIGFKVTEHKGINKITVHMPSTGVMSGSQTTSLYTSEPLQFQQIKFTTINTFQGEVVVVNTDYIIMVEFGKLVEVDNGYFFFVSDNEKYEVINRGDYGHSVPSFTKD
jgi:hypothetical protein